jgi:hypothetical protein
MLLIGELSQRTQTSTQTIRYYERLGLLNPSERNASQYRLYIETALAESSTVATEELYQGKICGLIQQESENPHRPR